MSENPYHLNDDCQAALDLAKRCVPEGGKLEPALLLSAIYHSTDLRKRFPGLDKKPLELNPPETLHQKAPERVPLAESLQSVFADLSERDSPVTSDELFRILLRSGPMRQRLADDIPPALAAFLGPAATSPTWRESRERQEAIEALSSFGRMLTATEPPFAGCVAMDAYIEKLEQTLVKKTRRNAIVHGPPGTGKTALVYEFARRVVRGHPSLSPKLKDIDIFELSPSFLRSGASVVGQYDKRVKSLIQVLKAYPKIILFVDEMHSLFKSGMHERGPFTEANEAFKRELAEGDITCIGCTTSAEFRHYIQPDGALKRRFEEIPIEAPSPEDTLRVLEARLEELASHYEPLRIPKELLQRVVDLTEDYLLSQYQPDKSIQLLDRACAVCVTADPPIEELTEDQLFEALEGTTGYKIAKEGQFQEQEVFEKLKSKILGQDDVLRPIAQAFVGGMGSWKDEKGPRGRFMFCGPTGVGKTETAVKLAEILGGGRPALLRVDCNTLQGSGRDSGPAMNRLLGPPPGYIGYVRGQGGLLSKIRDMADSIVLFDEFEKADPGVGQIIQQILDKGKTEDNDGNLLDFRRAFIVFTTNAGASYDSERPLGFTEGGQRVSTAPRADEEAVKAQLRATGHGEEFLGRHIRYFVFHGLDAEAIRLIIDKQLHGLQDAAEVRGFKFGWDPEIRDRMASRWQPRFGVRHLTTILRHRIREQLSVAEAQGELEGIQNIRLSLMDIEGIPEDYDVTGLAKRERSGETLIIYLA